MANLVIYDEVGDSEQVFELQAPVTTIGRSAENHLHLDDLNSSRHHCEVHQGAKGYELIDKGSRNGIFVNGLRVTRRLLEGGDKVEIGNTVLHFVESDPVNERSGRETVDITTGCFAAAKRSQVASSIRESQVTTSISREEIEAELEVSEETPATPTPELRAGEVQAELEELKRLVSLNKSLNTVLDLRKLLQQVMDTVIQVAGAERGFLLSRKADGQGFEVSISRNIDQESLRDAREKISSTLVKEVLEEHSSVLLRNAVQDQRYSNTKSIFNMQLRSVLVVPLCYRDEVRGAVYLDNRFAEARFTEKTREQVELVADAAMVAIENARLFEENTRQREELLYAKEELERLNQLLRTRVKAQDRELTWAREALAASREELHLKYNYDEIVTNSPKMLEILQILDKVCDSNVSVLVQGESGTGKELIARALHFNGPRKKAAFVSENCAAIPHNLMESEFFGYVRGAFTGATRDKIGLFEMADQGTLFLDEVGEMDMDMQTKLLRVLQDGVLRRVGSKEFKRVNTRIISATNRDLLAEISAGRFREDLYYRLNVINICLPPLRDRREDIPLLAEHLLKQQVAESGQERIISPEVMDLWMRYRWPGNIRELANEMMRACALSTQEIKPEHLSKAVSEGSRGQVLAPVKESRIRSFLLSGKSLKELVGIEVDALEAEAIGQVLRRTQYKKSKAASILGISRPTLDAKIEKHHLTREKVLGDEQS